MPFADVIKMNADGQYIHTRGLQYERQDKGYYGKRKLSSSFCYHHFVAVVYKNGDMGIYT